mmetsp:Transcript_4893/g.6640  ORF Transcript_4893/g.6640 Transcript_4893/m.6640 type:complete len:285 (+) Transcript_4893:121-975(+)|eukprot:CAMPEP_0196579490 /NCGR_PEP_ID=MMETSP1081-20130531/22033_1 /TAXON_ID=36882 /ORGANISM="Pyramimonas amylifera, Strain CCMP720" /LENGTH=284 /DNA_ID=CAMNT_0041899103 /DNA_START=121 /DNA_END=975 /DNA_ORIENTATION=-
MISKTFAISKAFAPMKMTLSGGAKSLSSELTVASSLLFNRGFASGTASGSSNTKVVVFGGSGFVGSHVCKALLALGVDVVSINRGGQTTTPPWDPWWKDVKWVRGDALEPESWRTHLAGATGVVSCVGAFGSNEFMKRVCGDATVNMVKEARDARVQRFAFISAHDYNLPSFVLQGYVQGKQLAEGAVMQGFPNSGVCLRPGFIHGTRYANGVPLNLSIIGNPLESVLRSEKALELANKQPMLLPVMVPPTHVEQIALVAARAATSGAIPAGMISAWDIPTYAL